jgi:cell division protein FtsL
MSTEGFFLFLFCEMLNKEVVLKMNRFDRQEKWLIVICIVVAFIMSLSILGRLFH